MATETTYCSDCKKNTLVVLDHSSGDVICTDCGLVVESSYIDETSEWRTFANESTTEDKDPNRVGSASNPLLSISTGGGGGGGGGVSAPLLSTVISKSTNGKSSSSSSSSSRYNDENRRWQSKNNIIDLNDADNRRQRTLIQAFKTIENMADRLGLVTTIKNRACENYKRVVVDDTSCSTFVKGSRNQDAIMAACLYVACRQEEKPRTVKEICLVGGVSKKELGRSKDYIMKKLNDQALTSAPVVVVQDQMGGTHQYSVAAAATDQHKMGTIHAEDFMRRFCSHLGMSNGAMKAAQEAVKKVSEELDIRRSPLSVAAAVIYMITQLSSVDNSLEQHEKKRQLLKDISAATGGVAEGTIKNAYRDIFPHATRLIPTSYAKEEDIKRKLCRS